MNGHPFSLCIPRVDTPNGHPFSLCYVVKNGHPKWTLNGHPKWTPLFPQLEREKWTPQKGQVLTGIKPLTKGDDRVLGVKVIPMDYQRKREER